MGLGVEASLSLEMDITNEVPEGYTPTDTSGNIQQDNTHVTKPLVTDKLDTEND